MPNVTYHSRVLLVAAFVVSSAVLAHADALSFYLMHRDLMTRLHFDPTPIEQWRDDVAAKDSTADATDSRKDQAAAVIPQDGK
jgi:hypothetical protein